MGIKRHGGAPSKGEFNGEHSIKMFMHCGKCIKEVVALSEIKGKASPRDYAQLEIGWTDHGLQVWCRRHNCNVVHIDFQGQTHPAIMK